MKKFIGIYLREQMLREYKKPEKGDSDEGHGYGNYHSAHHALLKHGESAMKNNGDDPSNPKNKKHLINEGHVHKSKLKDFHSELERHGFKREESHNGHYSHRFGDTHVHTDGYTEKKGYGDDDGGENYHEVLINHRAS